MKRSKLSKLCRNCLSISHNLHNDLLRQLRCCRKQGPLFHTMLMGNQLALDAKKAFVTLINNYSFNCSVTDTYALNSWSLRLAITVYRCSMPRASYVVLALLCWAGVAADTRWRDKCTNKKGICVLNKVRIPTMYPYLCLTFSPRIQNLVRQSSHIKHLSTVM